MSTQVVPPPYQITPDDKRGLVVVITGLTLAFVWTCFFIRLHLRLKVKEWKLDDSFLGAATVFGTIQSAIVFHQADDGLGNTGVVLTAVDLKRIGKGEFASQVLYILTLLLSKSAIIFLYLRLTPGRGHAIASWGTLALSAIWAVMSIILISFTRWQAIGALDIVTEFAIFFISIYLVAGLNMGIRSKAIVVGAFSARLPVIVACAVRLYYLRLTLTSSNPSLSAASSAVATQWQLGYSIMAITISGLGPFLRPFGKSYSTSNRQSSSFAGDPSTQHSSKSHNAFQLTSMQSASRSGEQTPAGQAARVDILDERALRPDGFSRRAIVEGGVEEDRVSVSSNDSKRLIITKKTGWCVEHDRASVAENRGNARSANMHASAVL
ncbi:hypothetical protein K432DRAFT_127387 [Lepidopterella palustris CBS 459.81]|uniref:Rhodopsin domain-containing protein n=1 Tax=Lepidopterella palustris CBS 459.81 TaxID=1314670 RepID=A0A8E2JC50_9PEZI|nr:hypothetical protein K432DRAFT_127387 [Lepidopterella palustris CBS 459.81]